MGVTATDTKMAVIALGWLRGIEAKVKFLSLEPLLEGIDLQWLLGMSNIKIDWIIIGAQTKPYKPPEIEWVREIVEAADRAGIPVFQKDNLQMLLGNNLRQEIPK